MHEILSIPYGFEDGFDVRIWKPGTTGIYSVKTTYSLAVDTSFSNEHLR